METILIHGNDVELTSAWASYLSQDGYAVLTASDQLEAAEITTMIKIDSVILATNNPATYLVLGKALKTRKFATRIIAVTRLRRLVLELLLETDEFAVMDAPFTFGALKGMVKGHNQKTEVMEDVLV